MIEFITRLYRQNTPIHTVWLAEDSIFHGDSSIGFLQPNGHTVMFMGDLNLQEVHNGNVYIDNDLMTSPRTTIGNSTVIVNGNVHVYENLWLSSPTSRLSIRGNLYNNKVADTRLTSAIMVQGATNGGALLDLKGDYIQAHALGRGFITNSGARVQLSGNSSQRIVFPEGGRVHLNNLYIRNQPSSYIISNGLNTYSIADAIANLPNSPKIWNNLFHDFEEVTIPNIPQPDDDEDEEVELPNNTGMLAWPADSGEVTLWFGIVDHLFDGVHNGIDIQDEIGAPVYSISNGIVTDVYNDPFYGNVVVIDFLYYGEFRRAKYCHLETVDIVTGEKVSKGQTIGRMGTDTRVDKGLLELRLYEDGGIAIDPFPFMVRPDVDLSFLLYPMAFSFSEGGIGRRSAMSNNHNLYMGNHYLEDGEVYLWEWAMEFIVSQGDYITRDQLYDDGILSWNALTQTATFRYGDITINVATQGYELGLGGNTDNGANSRLIGRVTETWRVAVAKDWLWAVSATEITYGQIVSGHLRNSISNRWYKIRRGNNNGLRVISYATNTVVGNIFSTFPNHNVSPIHEFLMNASESSFRDDGASNQWYYIRMHAGRLDNYSFVIFPPYLSQAESTIRFSAFSLGSNLFNICQLQINDSEHGLMEAYQAMVNFRPRKPVNPAEHFVYEMNDFFRHNQLNVLGLNYNFANSNFPYYRFLNKDNVMTYPNKAQVIAAMQTSDIVYIATHGTANRGLWIDRVENSYEPILVPARNDTAREAAEFKATEMQELIHPAADFGNLNTNRLKWLIMSACSQLNNPRNSDLTTDWSNALLRNNNAHGILGYHGVGPGHIRQNETTERFFQNLHEGTSFVDSWRLANISDTDEGITNRNWAALVNEAHRDDSMLNLPSSQSPTNAGHERTIWLYLREIPPINYRRIRMPSPSRNASSELDEFGANTTGIMAYYQSNASEDTRLEFDISSEYEFSISRIDYSLAESQKFDLSKHEIIELAIEYVIKLSPINDLYIADIGFVTRREMGPDGAGSNIEVLECEITVIPMINDLPVYSRDMHLHIIFDNEEIIKVECNLPEDFESFIESRVNIDYFSEDVLQSEVLTTFDENDVSRAYYFTETNELIPIYVADSASYEGVKIFRADTGEEIQF